VEATARKRLRGNHPDAKRPVFVVPVTFDQDLVVPQPADPGEVGGDPVRRRAGQVLRGHRSELAVEPVHRGVPGGRFGHHPFPDLGEPLLELVSRVLTAEHHHRPVVELGQQLGLPAGPDAGADRRDVSGGQHVQQPQRLGAAHAAAEPRDHVGIGQVASHRDLFHVEVVPDQEHQQVAIGPGQLEPLPDVRRQPGSHFAVMFGEALAQVVQQQRQVQQQLVVDRPAGRPDRPGVVQERVAGVDRPQRVFIDGEVVVLVELHQAAGMLDFRQQSLEHADLVHAPQHRPQETRTIENVPEQLPGPGRHVVGPGHRGPGDGIGQPR